MRKSKKVKDALTDEQVKELVSQNLRPWIFYIFRHVFRIERLSQEMQEIIELPISPGGKKWRLDNLIAQTEKYLEDANASILRTPCEISKSIHTIFLPLKKVKPFSIRNIRLFAEVFLEVYREAQEKNNQESTLPWLTDEDIRHLTSVAISTYLERWLEVDRRSKKTINAFSKYRYGDKSTITQQYIAGDCEKRERLYNAYTKFYELFELRQAQAERDHEKKSVAPYKRGGTTKLDLITLSWCDAWSEGQLEILKLWLFQKHFRNRKSDRDTQQNEKLYGHLRAYYSFLENTEKLFVHSNGFFPRNVEYVAKCILIQKIERAYHLQLIADSVGYCQRHGLRYADFNEPILDAYFGRYSGLDGVLFESFRSFDAEGKRKYIRSSDPLGALDYIQILELATKAHDPKQAEQEVVHELRRRCALMDLLTLLYAVFPFEQQHAWKAADFNAAANFYHTEYPIVPTFVRRGKELPPDGSEEAQRYCDLYHKAFKHIFNRVESPLKIASDRLYTKQSLQ